MVDTIRQPGAGLSAGQIAKVRQQAEEFEGVFLNTLTKQMFSGIKTDASAMGGGFGEETWRSMQSEQYAAMLAENGGIGLADQIMRELLASQEATAARTTSLPSGAYGS